MLSDRESRWTRHECSHSPHPISVGWADTVDNSDALREKSRKGNKKKNLPLALREKRRKESQAALGLGRHDLEPTLAAQLAAQLATGLGRHGGQLRRASRAQAARRLPRRGV